MSGSGINRLRAVNRLTHFTSRILDLAARMYFQRALSREEVGLIHKATVDALNRAVAREYPGTRWDWCGTDDLDQWLAEEMAALSDSSTKQHGLPDPIEEARERANSRECG